MMYRSRNSNPSQPNPKPLLLNKHAKIKYSENPNSVTEKMRSPFLQVDTHQKKQEWMGHRVTPSSPLPPSQLTETALILLLSSPSKPSPSQFPTQVKQQRSCEPVLFQSISWYHDSLFRRPLTTRSCGGGTCYLYFCVNPEVRAPTSQIQSHPASAIKEIR